MEASQWYDLFFIAIIAIVIARFLRRRQAAEARRRDEMNATAGRPADEATVLGSERAADGDEPDALDSTGDLDGGRAGAADLEEPASAAGTDAGAPPRAPDEPAAPPRDR